MASIDQLKKKLQQSGYQYQPPKEKTVKDIANEVHSGRYDVSGIISDAQREANANLDILEEWQKRASANEYISPEDFKRYKDASVKYGVARNTYNAYTGNKANGGKSIWSYINNHAAYMSSFIDEDDYKTSLLAPEKIRAEIARLEKERDSHKGTKHITNPYTGGYAGSVDYNDLTPEQEKAYEDRINKYKGYADDKQKQKENVYFLKYSGKSLEDINKIISENQTENANARSGNAPAGSLRFTTGATDRKNRIDDDELRWLENNKYLISPLEDLKNEAASIQEKFDLYSTLQSREKWAGEYAKDYADSHQQEYRDQGYGDQSWNIAFEAGKQEGYNKWLDEVSKYGNEETVSKAAARAKEDLDYIKQFVDYRETDVFKYEKVAQAKDLAKEYGVTITKEDIEKTREKYPMTLNGERVKRGDAAIIGTLSDDQWYALAVYDKILDEAGGYYPVLSYNGVGSYGVREGYSRNADMEALAKERDKLLGLLTEEAKQKAYNEELEKRRQIINGVGSKAPFLTELFGVALRPVTSAVSVFDNTVTELNGQPIDIFSPANMAVKTSQMSGEPLRQRLSSIFPQELPSWIPKELSGGDTVGDVIFNVVDMGLDNTIRFGIGSALGGLIGEAFNFDPSKIEDAKKVATLILGSTNAGASAIIDAKEKGYTDEEAMWAGLASAATEYITETWSVEAWFGDPSNIGKYIAKNLISEPSEELAGGTLGFVTDQLIFGKNSDFAKNVRKYIAEDGLSYKDAVSKAINDNRMETFKEAIIAALSTGISTTAGLVRGGMQNQYVRNQRDTAAGRQIIDTGDPSAVIQEAKASADSKTQKLAAKLENYSQEAASQRKQNAYARDIGKLNRSVTEGIGKETNAAVSSIVEEKTKEALKENNVPEKQYNATIKAVKTAVKDGYSLSNLNKLDVARIDKIGGKAFIDSLNTEEVNAAGMKAVFEGVKKRAVYEAKVNGKVGEQKFNANGIIATKTGEEVTLDPANPIQSITEKGVVFSTEDGATIKATDLSLPSYADAILVNDLREMANRYGMSVKSANTIYKYVTMANLDGSSVMPGVMRAYRLAREFGSTTTALEAEMQKEGSAISKIDPELAKKAYELGLSDKKADVKNWQKNVNKQKKKTAKSEKSQRTAGVRVSKEANAYINDKSISKEERSAAKASVEAAEMLTAAYGMDWNFVKGGLKDSAGNKANAQFESKDGRVTITVDITAKLNGKSLAIFAMSHELTHFIKDWSLTKFNTLAEFLIRKYGEIGEGETAEYLINKRMESGLTHDEALEEFVAECCERFLLDGNALQNASELAKSDPNLFKRFIAKIKEWIGKIRAAFAGHEAQSRESAITQTLDALEQIRALWEEALEDAGRNYRAAQGSEEGDTKNRSQTTVTPEEESRYLELAKDPAKNESELSRMVAEAEERAGYISPTLYHGTTKFGFTVFSNEFSDDKLSFFVTESADIAQTYSGKRGVQRLGKLPFKNIEKLSGEEIATLYRTYVDLYDEEKPIFIAPDDEGARVKMVTDAVDTFLGYSEITKHIEELDSAGAYDKAYLQDRIEAFKNNPNFLTAEQLYRAVEGVYNASQDAFYVDNPGDIFSDLRGPVLSAIALFNDEIAKKSGAMTYLVSGLLTGKKHRFCVDLPTFINLNAKPALGKGNYALVGNPGNQLIIDANGSRWDAISVDYMNPTLREAIEIHFAEDYVFQAYKNKAVNTRQISEYAYKAGYDSVLIKNIYDNGGEGVSAGLGNIQIYFNPSRLKSADPVTYDDDGNVIPLSERFNEEKSDIRYQTAVTPEESGSVRSTLASALASVATLEKDRAALKNYQAMVRSLDRNQAQLEKTRAEIYDYTFGEKRGQRTTEKLAALRQAADKLNKQITAADKRLLDLESTAPLKRVLENARKQEAAKTRQKLIEQRQAARHRQNRTAIKNAILSLEKDMRRRFTNSTKNAFMPKELYNTVLEFMTKINFDTVGTQRLAELDAQISKTRGEKTKQELEAKRERLLARQEQARTKLNDIAGQYKAAMEKMPEGDNRADSVVVNMLASAAETAGNTPIADMKDTQLATVFNALKALDTVIRNANRMFGKQFTETTREAGEKLIEELKNSGVEEGKLSGIIDMQLRPETMFKRFAGGAKNSEWVKLYNMLNEGQRKMLSLMSEFSMPFTDLMKDRKSLKSMQNELVDVGLKDSEGNTVEIPRGMVLSLYMHLLNEDNRTHFAFGGLSVPDFKTYYKGKQSQAYNNSTRAIGAGSDVIKLGQEIREVMEQLDEIQDKESDLDKATSRYRELEKRLADLQKQAEEAMEKSNKSLDEMQKRIYDMLTDYEKSWISAAQYFLDVESPAALNEVTMELYGFKKATVPNYFAIRTDPAYRSASFDSIAGDFSLENSGFMKDRINGARNPMLLEDLVDVISTQISKVSQYAGMVIPIKNFTKAFGTVQKGYTNSVQKELSSHFGTYGRKYIENYLAALNGSRQGEDNPLTPAINRLRGNVIGAVLTLNPRVALAQTASMPTAAAELGFAPVAKALFVIEKEGGKKGIFLFSSAEKELIRQYSPLLWYRLNSGSISEIGEIKSTRGGMAQFMDSKTGKALFGWISAMDGATVGRLWYASKYYVDDNFSDLKKAYDANPSSQKAKDAYYTKVAEVFNRVVERTQPNYTASQRPDVLRSKSALVRVLTPYMTQRLQNFNILYEAGLELSRYSKDFKSGKNDVTAQDVKDARKRFARAVGSQVLSTATLVGFKLLADMLLHRTGNYRDEDEELTAESVWIQMLESFGESVASNVIGGSEVYTAIMSAIRGKWYHGYEVNVISSVEDVLTGVYDATKTLVDAVKGDLSSERLGKMTLKYGEAIAQVFGIPATNAKKLGEAVYRHAQDIANGAFLSFEAGVERSMAQNVDRAYQAFASGDTQKAASLIKELLDKTVKEVGEKAEKDGSPITEESAVSVAKSKVRSALKDRLKEDYAKAVNTKDEKKAEEIRQFLVSSGAYDSEVAVKKEVGSWVIDAKYDGVDSAKFLESAMSYMISGSLGDADKAIQSAISRRADELKNGYDAEGKKVSDSEVEKEAKEKLKSYLKSHYKDQYIAARDSKDVEGANRIANFLKRTKLWGSDKEVQDMLNTMYNKAKKKSN